MTSSTVDPMLFIWEQVAKTRPDGNKYIIYQNKGDLEYLYATGFVDTDKFKIEDWINSFKESLRPDGSYQITQEQWLKKRAYRYSGPVNEPFDPLSLREGAWEMDEFDNMMKIKLSPSLSIPENILKQVLEKVKGTFSVGGKFIIHPAFKNEIKQLLVLYPSPRRLREISVAETKGNLAKQSINAKKVTESSEFRKGASTEKRVQDKLNQLLRKG